jgi:hypothetical protein
MRKSARRDRTFVPARLADRPGPTATKCISAVQRALRTYSHAAIGAGARRLILFTHLDWEAWKASQIAASTGPRGWLTPAAWNLLHPTRLAFVGVAGLALLTALLAAVDSWWGKPPAWDLILGFALLRSLGLLATCFLHRSFNRSAGT